MIFAALVVLFLGFLLCGCMSTNKAIGYLEKKGKLAGTCADHYPVVDSAGKTTIVYRPADNVDHTKQLDSLKNDFDQQLQAFKDAQHAQAHDTGCVRTIQELQRQYENLRDQYLDLKAKYKPCNPDTAFITKDVYHDTNPAKTAALQQQVTEYKTKYETAQDKASKRGKLIGGAGILIAVGMGAFVIAKFKIL